jgi:hypothetical protein
MKLLLNLILLAGLSLIGMSIYTLFTPDYGLSYVSGIIGLISIGIYHIEKSYLDHDRHQ